MSRPPEEQLNVEIPYGMISPGDTMTIMTAPQCHKVYLEFTKKGKFISTRKIREWLPSDFSGTLAGIPRIRW